MAGLIKSNGLQSTAMHKAKSGNNVQCIRATGDLLKLGQRRRFVLVPQEHTVMVRQTSKWGQIFLLTLVALGAATFGTAYIYKIDRGEFASEPEIIIPQDMQFNEQGQLLEDN